MWVDLLAELTAEVLLSLTAPQVRLPGQVGSGATLSSGQD